MSTPHAYLRHYFRIGGKFLKFYGVTCSYSSHPFLRALDGNAIDTQTYTQPVL